jgi:hypothetical protein
MNFNEELERYSSDHDFLKAFAQNEKDIDFLEKSLDV